MVTKTMSDRATPLDSTIDALTRPDYIPMIEGTPYRADCDVSRVSGATARPCSLEPGVGPATWVTPDTMDEPQLRFCRQHRYPTAAECSRRAADLELKALEADGRIAFARSDFDRDWHERAAAWCRERAQEYRHAPSEGRTFDQFELVERRDGIFDQVPARTRRPNSAADETLQGSSMRQKILRLFKKRLPPGTVQTALDHQYNNGVAVGTILMSLPVGGTIAGVGLVALEPMPTVIGAVVAASGGLMIWLTRKKARLERDRFLLRLEYGHEPTTPPYFRNLIVGKP